MACCRPSHGTITDDGEAIDGTLALNRFVIAYWRMRFIVYWHHTGPHVAQLNPCPHRRNE